MNQIFQIRYFNTFNVNLSKDIGWQGLRSKIIRIDHSFSATRKALFGKLWRLVNLQLVLQYLIWKIWSISVWSQKIKILARLLRYFILIWNDPILLHTEDLVSFVSLSTVWKNVCLKFHKFGHSNLHNHIQVATWGWFDAHICRDKRRREFLMTRQSSRFQI